MWEKVKQKLRNKPLTKKKKKKKGVGANVPCVSRCGMFEYRVCEKINNI